MKKQLLLGSALLAALTAFPQNGRVTRPAGTSVADANKRIAARLAAEAKYAESTAHTTAQNPETETSGGQPTSSKTSSFVSSWNPIGSSMNAYGVVITHTKPLQYNEDLNAVTFIHRGSSNYPASPTPAATAKSGVIVAEVTQNWGASWDSTLLWNDNSNWARYPQGAILNSAPGNTNIANAHIVGNAAVTSASNGWIGNGFFAKSLAAYTNSTAATNSFIPVLSGVFGKADFTVYDFQTTDDGKAVAIGYVNNDPNGATSAQFGYRGARVVKGSFVAGNMVWTGDSIIPSVTMSNGTRNVLSRPRMAWSEDGQVGYVMHIGVASTATLNNRGYQPIIHRTGDGGVSWSAVNGINFNLPAMSTVTNMILSPNTNSNVTIPYFDLGEGIGMTVDKNNKLHITSILRGTSSDHPDSTSYVFIFNNADGEQYWYAHRPGLRPTVYDFVGDGLPNSPWAVTVIDSLSSEAPGTDAVTDTRGYTTNPWDEVDNGKVAVEARLQTSRTPDGKYIVYTWGESDTNFTSGPYFKWNELPNIKARLMDVTTGQVNPTEINVTRPGANNPFLVNNPLVSSRAYLHYAAPKCALAQTIAVGPAGPAIILPLTSSRPYGIPLQQTAEIVHRYMSAILNFGGLTQNDISVPQAPVSGGGGGTVNAVSESQQLSVNASVIYPNPAKDNANLAIGLERGAKIDVSVVNMIGQVVKRSSFNAEAGVNTLNIDLNGLSQGVYMVNVKIGTSTSAKKLIIE